LIFLSRKWGIEILYGSNKFAEQGARFAKGPNPNLPSAVYWISIKDLHFVIATGREKICSTFHLFISVVLLELGCRNLSGFSW